MVGRVGGSSSGVRQWASQKLTVFGTREGGLARGARFQAADNACEIERKCNLLLPWGTLGDIDRKDPSPTRREFTV